jgi:outer membrane beta-barrel protein
MEYRKSPQGTKQMKLILQMISALAFILVASGALADNAHDNVSDELENLDSNQQVSDRAAHLDSRTRAAIVQGRAVDRNWRFEFGLNYGPTAFGDNFLNTQDVGANVDLHINPHFSIGVHYAKAFNQLTAEGQTQFNNAQASFNTTPEISYAEQSVMGVLDWYMTYGKINLFDWKVVQFDIYTLAGYGQEEVLTDIGPSSQDQWTGTWTAGAGIGFWLSQHVTSRFELRYQTYADENGSRNLNLAVATVGIGVLL